MKAHRVFATVFAMALAAALPSRAVAVELQPDQRQPDERIVPESRIARVVTVRNAQADDDGTVSGVLVNNSDKVLRDVRVMVRRTWLWDNELHPGTDDFSRAEYYTLRQELPPGGQVPFTVRSESPLRGGGDGHFVTDVRVTGMTQYVASPAPTAGTSAAPPAPNSGGLPPPAERRLEGY